MTDLKTISTEAQESARYLASDEKSSTQKASIATKENHPEVKPWVHFLAGGIGGMAGAVCTSPFDLVKTRLQSDVYSQSYKRAMQSSNPVLQGVQHLKETFGIIKNVYSTEGVRALFKGLGPNLVGVIPARSINFFTYGTGKEFISKRFNNGEEATWVHLCAAICAGIATSTATNPIWLVKTRLQLDKSGGSKLYKNSWDCTKAVVRTEGISGLYKGLTASYLGSVESTIQWVLYEQMKSVISANATKRALDGHERTTWDSVLEWGARSGSAGCAKFVASLITYPHEVIRTRLRQAPLEGGKLKYTGLVQCFKLVVKEEGLASMYGGLTPHLLRTVPNSIIMFGTWELVIKLLS